MWDSDLSDEGLEEEEIEAPKPAASKAAANDSDDFDDDWEDAEDPDEVKKRKEEEAKLVELKKKEEEDAAKARKEEKQRRKEERKEARKKASAMLDADDGDEGGLFDVEVSHENQARMDFANATDLIGDIGDGEEIDISKIDIGRYEPTTVEHFNAYKEAIVRKVQSLDIAKDAKKLRRDYVDLINHMIDALTDAYKAVHLKEIEAFLTEQWNKKNGKKVPSGKKSGGASFIVVDDHNTNDDD